MQVLRCARDQRSGDLAVSFIVPQRAGTLFAAAHLLRGNFAIRTIECTYALPTGALNSLLGVTDDKPERLTSLRLQVRPSLNTNF